MSVVITQIRIASKSDLLVRGMRGCGWGLITRCLKRRTFVGWKVGQYEHSGDISFWELKGETKQSSRIHDRSLRAAGEGRISRPCGPGLVAERKEEEEWGKRDPDEKRTYRIHDHAF